MRKNQIKNKHVYFIILAGGNGERLWPLSRQTHPKQLLTIGQSSTLIEQAIDRVMPLAYSHDNVWISTTKDYEHAIRTHVADTVKNIIVEPVSRNTGASILYCCHILQQHDPKALAIFLPADAFIPSQENANFTAHVQQIIQAIVTDDIITLSGIKPTHPATSYGYIEFDTNISNTAGLYKVIHFHEKPSHDVANYYMLSNTIVWNIGMFGAKVSVFINAFEKAAPTLFNAINAYLQGTGSYEETPNNSIDCAVIEKSSNVWMLPAQFTWCDVGNLDIFLTLQEKYGQKKTNLIEIDACNNLVQIPNNFVAIIGINDICVIQTDNILLITSREKTDLVKNIVHQLKKQGNQEYL